MRALAPLALALTTLFTATFAAAPAAEAAATASGTYPAPAWPQADGPAAVQIAFGLTGERGRGHRRDYDRHHDDGHHHGKHGSATRRVWVPGAWVERTERVWVPGHTERVWQEPRFSWRYDSCGQRMKIAIGTGCWKTVHHPGHFDHHTVRVWQPGHWTVVRC